MQEHLKVRVGGDIVGLNTALGRAVKEVDKFKRRVIKVGIGLVGTLAPSVMLGVSFEKNMKFVGAVTQATGKQFQSMTKLARELGKTTEYTATQAAEGLKFLGMAGFDAEQSMEALPGVLNLATAGMMELGEAADIATNILTQMDLEVRELTRVNDVLAKVQSTANTNIKQAAEAFVYGGTMARQMGMQVEELAAFIGLLANRGIRASLAGTTLRQAIMKTLNPSKEAAEVMHKYGISVNDASGNLRNFTDVILDMVDSGMNAQEASKLLGARAGQLAAIFNMTSKEVREYIDVIKFSAGTTDTLAKSIRETLWGSFRALWSALQEVGLALYYKYKEPLKDLVDTTVEYVRELGTWIDLNEELLKQKFTQYLNDAESAMRSIINLITTYPEVMKYGVIGWFFGGKYGAGIGAAIGGTLKWLEGQEMKDIIDVYTRKISELEKELKPLRERVARKTYYSSQGQKVPGLPEDILEVKKKEQDIAALRRLIRLEEQKKEQKDFIVGLTKQTQAEYDALQFQKEQLMKVTKEKFEQKAKIMKQYSEEEEKREKEIAKRKEEINKKVQENTWEIAQIGLSGTQEAWADYHKAVDDAEKEHWGTIRKGMELAYNDYVKKTKEAHKEVEKQWKEHEEIVRTVATSLSYSFTDAFMDIIKGIRSVANSFRNMTISILEDIARIVFQKQVSEPIAEGLSGVITSGLGKIFSSFTAPSTVTSHGWSGGGLEWGGLWHTGGTVGKTKVPQILLPTEIFKKAPKLHKGTEYPAVLKKGERVLQEGQYDAPNIIINFNNETGAPATLEQQGPPKFDGQRWVMSMVLKGLESPGFRRAIRSA